MEKKEKKTETFENSNKKSIAKKVFDIVFWVVISILLITWVTDFVNVKQNNKPIFCLKRIEHKYDDGTTNECIGLGYKVYNYNRKTINIKTQFSPFFIEMEK